MTRISGHRPGPFSAVAMLSFLRRGAESLQTRDKRTSWKTGPEKVGTRSPRRILTLAFDRMTLFNIAAPLEAFAAVGILRRPPGSPSPYYDTTVVTVAGSEVKSWSGIRIGTDPLPEVTDIDTLIVPGAMHVDALLQDRDILSWIAAQAPRARRLCGIGAGVLLLAAAGVIPGKRVVTHWYWSERLRDQFPDLLVEPDTVFVRDGHVLTGGGMSASIDIALDMIEEDLGRLFALQVAHGMVVPLKRAAGQSQISSMLKIQAADDGRFGELHHWLQGNLAQDLRVERLADRVGMSERGFSRAFVRRVGLTPAKAIETMRLEAAQRALEQTMLSIKTIARDCGFGDEERMRRAFVRTLGIQPKDYRRRQQPGS
jgi:transcriptional regulator GlxA family with amidase domain